MGEFSIWHFIALLMTVPWIWATARILRRMGFSGWWAAIVWIAPLNLIGLVGLALVRWPVEERGSSTRSSRLPPAGGGG